MTVAKFIRFNDDPPDVPILQPDHAQFSAQLQT